MSGLEVVGGVAAVAQIVTQSLGILREIYNTVDRLKKHAQCLGMVADEVTRAIRLVSMIESEPALSIEPILSGVEEVYDRANSLYMVVQRLDEADKRNSLVKQFTYQLLRQPQEQIELDNLANSLKGARDTLLGYIQVAHVGITLRKDADGAIDTRVAINTKVVDQVDSMLHDCPRQESGLFVASLLRDLRQRGIINDDDQEAYIDKRCLSELEHARNSKGDTPTSFIARDLVSHMNAVQVAGPIGDGTADRDAFLKFNHIELTGLTANQGSLQVAGPNSTNTLNGLKAHQLRLAAINGGQQLPRELFFRDT